MNIGSAVDTCVAPPRIAKQERSAGRSFMRLSIFWSKPSSLNGSLNDIGRELSGDRRNEREKTQLRQALRGATRGIQQACIQDTMSDLERLIQNG
jgi:hypothetical protein